MVGLEERGVLPPHREGPRDALPTVEYESLEGAHHGSPEMSPGGIAARIVELFATADDGAVAVLSRWHSVPLFAELSTDILAG